MTDYSELTDDQINKLIAHTENPIITTPDYCSDDAAMMPIVWANNISLEHETLNGNFWGEDKWGASGEVPDGYGGSVCFSSFNKNPKRAAATCFLMMQDAKG